MKEMPEDIKLEKIAREPFKMPEKEKVLPEREKPRIERLLSLLEETIREKTRRYDIDYVVGGKVSMSNLEREKFERGQITKVTYTNGRGDKFDLEIDPIGIFEDDFNNAGKSAEESVHHYGELNFKELEERLAYLNPSVELVEENEMDLGRKKL